MENIFQIFFGFFIFGFLIISPIWIFIKSLRFGWGGRMSIIVCFTLLLTLLFCVIYPMMNYYCYYCKKYQFEAKQSLGMIAKNQKAYFAEFGTYADSSEKLGFAVKGDTQTYTYSYSGVSKIGYTAIATSKAQGIKGCKPGEGNDVWTINEKLDMKNIKNACSDDAPPCLHSVYYFILFFIISYVLYDLFKKKSDSR